MNTATEIKWYDKNWLVILLCVLFFPVGLYGLWKNSSIGKGWKISVTILISLIFLVQLNKEMSKSSNSEVQDSSQNQVQKQAENHVQTNQNDISSNQSESQNQNESINYLEPTDINVDKSLIGKEVYVKGYFKIFAQWKYLYDEAGSPNFIQMNIDKLPKETQKQLFKECNQGCDLKFKGVVKDSYGTIVLFASEVL